MSESKIDKRLMWLSARILGHQIEFHDLKEMKRQMGFGRRGLTTTYRVRKTRVRSYVRRGFTAVRLNGVQAN